MEARRAFVGTKSYRQLWIVLAALLAAVALAAGAALISGSMASSGARAPFVTHAAPGTVLRQDNPSYAPAYSTQVQDLDRESNPGNQTLNHPKHKVTVF